MTIPKSNTKYTILGNSKYFRSKYGTSNPVIVIEKESRLDWNPPSFLFQGRALAEGIPVSEGTYYGHINGLGEYVHESELEEIK